MKKMSSHTTTGHTASLRKAPKTEKISKSKKGNDMEKIQMEPETGLEDLVAECNEQVADAQEDPVTEEENEAFVEAASEMVAKPIRLDTFGNPDAPESKSSFNRLATHRKGFQKSVIEGTKKKVVDCGDEVAEMLRGLELEEVYTLLEETTKVSYREAYAHLNPGQQRMNLGNRLRAFVRKSRQPQPQA
jgi:hypothetical protein